MRFPIIICLLYSIVLTFSVKAQDPVFSQFYSNPLYLNPSFAGASLCPRVTINYRNQWPKLKGNYTTYAISYDQSISKIDLGYGLTVLYDRAGEGSLGQTMAMLSFAKPVRLSKTWTLSFGLQTVYGNRRIKWEDLTFSDMLDSRRGFVNQTAETPHNNIHYFDANAGLSLYGKYFFGGIAMHNILQPTVGLSQFSGYLPRRYTVHAGGKIPLRSHWNDNFSLSPNVIFTVQGNFYQVSSGLYAQMHWITLGAWYRSNDAIIGLVGFQKDQLGIGYSFDFPVGLKRLSTSGGTHEISFTYTFACKAAQKKASRLSCPHF